MDNIFDDVAAKLSSAGMDDASVTASKKALQDAFSGLSEEEFQKKLEAEGGTEGITDSILKKYEEAKKRKTETGGDIINIDDNLFSDEADETPAETQDKENGNNEADELPDADAESADEENIDRIIAEIDGNGNSSSSKADEYFNDDDDDVKVKQPENKKKTGKKPSDLPAKQADRNAPKKKNVSVKNMSSRAKTIYIIGLVFLIPLVIALVVAITVLFLSLYAAVIFLVIAFSVALVLIAALGTALSLMAIVFGIIQIVKGVAAPIGIYEIGLGIAAGGVTLGVSILLYNFIVRLAPFLFKKMFVLYKFLFRQLTKLMSFVKGACSKL